MLRRLTSSSWTIPVALITILALYTMDWFSHRSEDSPGNEKRDCDTVTAEKTVTATRSGEACARRDTESAVTAS
jgi:hypothetical protein